MKLSQYFLSFPCASAGEDLILFSTRKMSKIRVSKATFRRIEAGDLSASETETLSKLGFLVHDLQEERAAVLGLFDRLNAANPDLDITVVLNLDCNFSCRYCYEGGPSGNRYMTRQIADQLIDFIQRHFTPEKRNLLLTFYGGEPLLSVDLIRYIAQPLNAFAESRNAQFSGRLITNGSLLKRAVVEALVSLGVTSAKITLDGPEETHNHYRPFKSGAGSFDIIIKNIKETCERIRIAIGGNYDEESWPTFVSLLDFLEVSGLTADRLSMVKFDPIMKPANQPHLLAKYHGGCTCAHEPWIIKADRVLRREILKRGYPIQKVHPIMCAIENKSTFVVNYDGRLYKCPAFAGHEEFCIGDLTGEIPSYDYRYRLDIWRTNETCQECVYLPLCFGGCRYLSFLKEGRIQSLDCKKEALEATLETLINQEITYPASRPA